MTRPVLGSAKGHNGQLSFDGYFVSITRKGFLGRASVGKGDKRIPLSSITAIQIKPAGPMINGYIQFTLSGGIERRAKFGSQTNQAGHDENSVVFTSSQSSAIHQFRDLVEMSMIGATTAAASTPAAAPPGWYQTTLGDTRYWDGQQWAAS